MPFQQMRITTIYYLQKVRTQAQAVNKQIDHKVFESKDRVILNLSNNTGASQHPQIATTDNNIYVVWEDNTYSNKEILFTKRY